VEGTYGAARGAVDVALTAVDLVLAGAPAAYGLCRPPGHHAPRAAYGGYCYFNNAAIAAHHIATSTGTKVTVLDVDYHHGNGTQQIFYARDDVQYVSLHGDPNRAYPYFAGYADECGAGRGLGANRNFPLPAGTDDDLFESTLAAALEAVAGFDPAVLVVSLGVDTYRDDPIADFALSTPGFGRCGALVAGLRRPTVVLQEGGYDVGTIGENVRTWLAGFEGG
jgi:acetoin utilization deacetylase AcuC-like enzyme